MNGNTIKQTIKNILEKFPPFRQLLTHLKMLEQRLNRRIDAVQQENFYLKDIIFKQNNELSELKNELVSLHTQIETLQIMVKKATEAIECTSKSFQQLDTFSKASNLDGQIQQKLNKYAEKNQIKQLDTRISDAFVQMNYLYYKGLHPDFYEQALCEWFYQKTGQHLDLENPTTYNEKLQWLKLYDCTPLKTLLVDKFLVRSWVAEKIGKEYLVPLIGVWDSFDMIDFEKLPQKFVLKANHGSSWNMIVKDKSQLNYSQARSNFDKWMNKNFAFHNGFELQYLNVPRKIIAEEYLDTLEKVSDYRFMCFDGIIKMVWLDTYQNNEHFRTFFTPNWEKMNLKMRYPTTSDIIPKPKNYEKMLEIASALSQGFAHVRVDLYNVDGKIYFGEMTFSSTSGTLGVEPKEFEYVMGSWIKLPEKSSTPKLLIGNRIEKPM